MKRYRLMIPGPVEVVPEVLAEMAQPLVAHYGEEWTAFYKETIDLLRKVFQTKGDVFLIVGSGSAGLDAALGSTVAPDKNGNSFEGGYDASILFLRTCIRGYKRLY